MKFISQAINGLPPSSSLIDKIKKTLNAPQKARSHKQVHASDLTKEHFCPREVAILDITGLERKDELPGVAQSTCWDVGSALADLVRERWLGPSVFGNWRCVRCGGLQTFCFRPPPTAGLCASVFGEHLWKYEEMLFISKTYGFSGSIDCFVDLGGSRLTLVELKSIDKDEFAKLSAPYSEHRLRTNLYMKLVDDSSHPCKPKINCSQARILYVMKGYGKKSSDGDIHPFKEFVVDRNDADLVLPLMRAASVHEFRTTGKVPPHLGSDKYCPKSKVCSVAMHCLSGKIPSVVPLTTSTGGDSVLADKVTA